MANLEIGSENETGAHLRGLGGWPYSIYRRDDEIGCCDRVICHGIQNLSDAALLLELLNSAEDKLSAPYARLRVAA